MSSKPYIVNVDDEEGSSKILYLGSSLQTKPMSGGLISTHTSNIAALPIWARRERLMKRHRTLTLESIPTPGSSLEDVEAPLLENFRQRQSSSFRNFVKPKAEVPLINKIQDLNSPPLKENEKKTSIKITAFLMPSTPEQIDLNKREASPHRKVFLLSIFNNFFTIKHLFIFLLLLVSLFFFFFF